jgi:hypothetical protein
LFDLLIFSTFCQNSRLIYFIFSHVFSDEGRTQPVLGRARQILGMSKQARDKRKGHRGTVCRHQEVIRKIVFHPVGQTFRQKAVIFAVQRENRKTRVRTA